MRSLGSLGYRERPWFKKTQKANKNPQQNKVEPDGRGCYCENILKSFLFRKRMEENDTNTHFKTGMHTDSIRIMSKRTE
jgi:hypothetical protein